MIRSSRTRVAVCISLVLPMLAVWLLTRPSEAAKRRRPRSPEAAAAQPADVLLYLPDNCGTFGTVNFEAMRDSHGIAQLAGENPAFGEIPALVEEWIGLAPGRIRQVTFAAAKREKDGRDAEDEDARGDVEVIELIGPVTAEEVLQGLGKYAPYEWREEKVGRVRLFVERSDEPRAFFLPDQRTVVIGSAGLLRAAIRRNAPAMLPEKLAFAREQLDSSQLLSLAVSVRDDINAEEIPLIPDDVIEGLDSLLVHVDVVSHVHLRVAILCRDETVAYQIKGLFGAAWKWMRTLVDAGIEADEDSNVPEDAVELLDSLKYAVNGRSFAVQVAIPTTLLADSDVESVRSGISDLSELSAMVPPVFPFGFAAGTASPAPVFMEGEIRPIEESETGGVSTYAYSSGGGYGATAQDAQPALIKEGAGTEFTNNTAEGAVCGAESYREETVKATYGWAPPPTSTLSRPSAETEAESDRWKERADKLETSSQAEMEALKQRIELLERQCRHLAGCLELAKQDRDLFQERAELYQRALANHVKQLDLPPKEIRKMEACPFSGHAAPHMGPSEVKPVPNPALNPYTVEPSVLIPEEARAPSTIAPPAEDKTSARAGNGSPFAREQKLIFSSEPLRELTDEWERGWMLEQPE
jgi:hypothetical protein